MKIGMLAFDYHYSHDAIQDALGLAPGGQNVKTGMAFAYGVRLGRTDPWVDPAALSESAQAKLARAIKQHTHALTVEFEDRVRAEAVARVEGMMVPHWLDRIKQADAILKHRKGVMTKAQFNALKKTAHPDNGASPETRAEAFQLLEKLELFLLDEKQKPLTNGLPKTSAEFMAMKKKGKS
jgi:hypothetical protein